ncbi:hypothetical protein BT67DRAFT_439855 [Trichocladium antarcticum]|uniref:Uncharacterized protein n=1 Tax=Trichocladium antarcticum TaxID=1450529 RepID=A0AAN6UQI7_9PEZI|nr:hypothetical protein BT67DRAFT_439855 [Trichocladium antarcticum]
MTLAVKQGSTQNIRRRVRLIAFGAARKPSEEIGDDVKRLESTDLGYGLPGYTGQRTECHLTTIRIAGPRR